MSPPPTPGSRSWPAMAYDSQSDRTILYGADSGSAPSNGTWSYSYAQNRWRDMGTPNLLIGRHNPALAYDSESDRTILFGGGDLAPHFGANGMNDTWAYDYDSNTWSRRHPASDPAPRWGNAMAYDSAADRVILFGGCVSAPVDLCNAAGDTWAYDLNADRWAALGPSPAPPPRFYHAMAYDRPADLVILFGGYSPSGGYGDTWTYSYRTNTWTNVTPAASPPAQANVAMSYDSLADRIVLATSAPPNHVWTYDVTRNAWMDLGTPLSSSYGELAAAYDSRAGETIVFTGQTVAVDTFGGVDDRGPPPAPSRDFNPPEMTYDSGTDRILLLEADESRWPPGSRMWSYDVDANVWANVGAVALPRGRFEGAMAYAPDVGRTILFGGYGLWVSGVVNDTWGYDSGSNSWTELTPGLSPPPRYEHVAAYDSQSRRLIVFGGCLMPCRAGVLGDTWAYDPSANRWAMMNPATSPPARFWTSMTYDSTSDRVILFGGCGDADCALVLGDTWAYDYDSDTWTKRSPGASPTARFHHAMAYDAAADRVVLFGGITMGRELPGETWEYAFGSDTWTETTPAGSPPPQNGHVMAYDSGSQRVVLWSPTWDGGTWAYGEGGVPPASSGPPLILAGVLAVAVAAIAAFLVVLVRMNRGRRAG
ncbi:MAG: hypothetical protein E6K10_01335 [Methanobacteriota archaeon]|nr:MAG: hypothetical protein E6K10_01335 [Euryarchaeota archaeon]